MKVDEILLRAYVDGELDPQRRDQVEAVLAHSPELKELADTMRASCLPFRAAYDSQALPPIPQRLVQQVSTWSGLITTGSPAAPAHLVAAQRRRQVLGWGMGLAASFTAGWLLPWRPFGDESSVPGLAPWVTAIVGYHAMYVRATVDAQADRPERLQALLTDFAPALQPRLRVLDLSSAGLSFRRVQRLGFEGVPLLQMVYLPVQGLPAALCVLPVSSSDAAPAISRDKGLGVAAWVDHGLAYVLVADMTVDAVSSLAGRIWRGEFSSA